MFLLINMNNYLDKYLDSIYYRCYGFNKVQFSSNVNLYAYYMTYNDFMNYMYQIYLNDNGKSNKTKYVMDISMNKIQLNRINVLSSIWTNKFGQAFDIIGNTIDRKTGLKFCHPELNMIGYNGIIIQIINNIIQVRVLVTNDGNMAFVLLGACSRLEISGELPAPAPGNLIFWKGVKVGKQLYDSYLVLIV